MELRRYLRVLRQHLLLILATVLIGAVIGFATTSKAHVYKATATIYVGARDLSTNAQQFYGTFGLDQVVTTFAQMIPSPVIAESVIHSTHLPLNPTSVAKHTAATARLNTTLIDVTVTNNDPHDAQLLANGIVNTFTAKVNTYNGSQNAPGTLPSEPAYVYQPAALPTSPLSTGTSKHVLLGALLGLVVAILAAFLRDYLDLSIRSADDAERRLGLPVLGSIPLRRDIDRKPAPPRAPGVPVGATRA